MHVKSFAPNNADHRGSHTSQGRAHSLDSINGFNDICHEEAIKLSSGMTTAVLRLFVMVWSLGVFALSRFVFIVSGLSSELEL